MENSKTKNIASKIIQGLIGLMFLMGAIGNMVPFETAAAQAIALGYLECKLFTLGVILFIATVLYLIPRTNVLGAALLTAWFGGAVATHIINDDTLIETVMPVIFGIVVWISIWLRNEKLRAIFPFS